MVKLPILTLVITKIKRNGITLTNLFCELLNVIKKIVSSTHYLINMLLPFLNSLLLGNKYYPLNTVTINSQNLLDNYRYLSSLNPHRELAPVLKSNAYGHGILEIARLLDPLSPPFFCVDSLYEAYDLYKKSVKTPILIMGYIDPRNLQIKKLPFSYAVYTKEMLDFLNKYQKGAKIHIFLDTGMHREGIQLPELKRFLDYAKTLPYIRIEGIMSHLACGDKKDSQLTQKQLIEFKKAEAMVHNFGFKPRYTHLEASSAFLNQVSNNTNASRVGLSLYGIDPEGKDKNLLPVFSLRTHITQIKELKPGDSVGYDATFTASGYMKIGILPIGYNDGVNRNLSNKGAVLIDGVYYNIIGRVSMNITVVDITRMVSPQIGQEVIIYSDKDSDKNSIENSSKLCSLIPYNMLTNISSSIKRKII